jgi:chromosomal replication initiator protein
LTTCDREVVAALGEVLAQRIGEPRYNLWFAPNTNYSWDDDVLVIGVTNHFFQDWLASAFGEDVRAAAGAALGRPVSIQFRIDPALFQAARRAQMESAGITLGSTAPPANHQPATSLEPAIDSGPLESNRPKRSRRWHRLDDFVVGPCNRLAHAAATSAIEAPGGAVNPLVLYGPVGTGKTHLLEGIYAGLRKRYPDWRVLFSTAEDFTNRFLHALRSGKVAAIRKHFRECDALLIDDSQFLAGKSATEEEFLHTFDTLHADGRQIVVTCDCHPRLAGDFTPLLGDRLAGGAVWGLQIPDDETRLPILRTKATRGEPRVPDEVLRYIADCLRGNVRELEGALQSVRHYSLVAGRAIDMALARESLSDLLRHSVRTVQLAQIDEAVGRVLGLDRSALRGKERARSTSYPRMLAMYLARKHTATTHGEIGRYFGGRNHSTVVAADKKVRGWLSSDQQFHHGQQSWRVRELLEGIERELYR